MKNTKNKNTKNKSKKMLTIKLTNKQKKEQRKQKKLDLQKLQEQEQQDLKDISKNAYIEDPNEQTLLVYLKENVFPTIHDDFFQMSFEDDEVLNDEFLHLGDDEFQEYMEEHFFEYYIKYLMVYGHPRIIDCLQKNMDFSELIMDTRNLRR